MQSPNDPPSSRQRWVPFDEARMILRMTEGTLRREIRAGRITGEQRRRNPDSPTDQRLVWEVLVTDPPETDAGSESGQTPTLATEPPALATRLLDKLDERDETIATQAETIADLRERVGKAEADVRHLAERLAAERAAREKAERSWWARLAFWREPG